jgi:hypothetical protein
MDFCKDGSQLGLYSQIWVNLTRDDGHFCYIFLWTVDPLKLHKEIPKKKPTDRYSLETLSEWTKWIDIGKRGF